jgi:F0F1-type ATP synthase membrane subunit b/b'
VNASLWTFVFEIANFLSLAAILAWLFFKPVRQALADHAAKAKLLEDQAAQKLADAERLQSDLQCQRQELNSQLEELRSKSLEAAHREAQRVIAAGRAQIDRERETLRQEALNIDRTQTARIARSVATVTSQAVKELLVQLSGPELEQTLVQAACRQLQGLPQGSLAPVVIECASALKEQSRQCIISALGESAQSAVFRVAPDLLGGVRVSTNCGLIDASIRGLANFAEHALLAEMDALLREESRND